MFKWTKQCWQAFSWIFSPPKLDCWQPLECIIGVLSILTLNDKKQTKLITTTEVTVLFNPQWHFKKLPCVFRKVPPMEKDFYSSFPEIYFRSLWSKQKHLRLSFPSLSLYHNKGLPLERYTLTLVNATLYPKKDENKKATDASFEEIFSVHYPFQLTLQEPFWCQYWGESVQKLPGNNPCQNSWLGWKWNAQEIKQGELKHDHSGTATIQHLGLYYLLGKKDKLASLSVTLPVIRLWL